MQMFLLKNRTHHVITFGVFIAGLSAVRNTVSREENQNCAARVEVEHMTVLKCIYGNNKPIP